MGIERFARHIADHGTTYSRADIMAILYMAVDCMREQLLEGKTNVDISAPINPDGSPSNPGGTTQPKKHTLTVRSANESQGSVSGGGTFDEGSTQTVQATPKTGFAFDKWSDGSTQNPRTVKLTSDLTLTASL